MREHSRTWPLWVAAAVMAILVLWLLWPASEDTLARVRAGEPLRVGYAVEAPFAFRDPSGEVRGHLPGTLRAVLSRLGIERVQWVQGEFGAMLGDLEAGRCDLVAAGLYITPERQARVRFCRPVALINHGLLVRAGNPKGVHAYADLAARDDVTVASLAGGVETAIARRVGVPEGRFLIVTDVQAGARLVQEGKADALPLSIPTVRWFVRNLPGGGVESVEPFGVPPDAVGMCDSFAVRPGDAALAAAIDRVLPEALADPAVKAFHDTYGFAPPPEGR